MKILFVASEVAPFAKTGGLADVTGSLPRALARMGHQVAIILPLHRMVRQRGFPPTDTGLRLTVAMGRQREVCGVRQLDHEGVRVWFIDRPELFERNGLYGEAGVDYPDNAQRYGFFCRAVLEALPRLGFQPELIHVHDWQTGLIPLLLATELHSTPFYRSIASLLTIHNLAYQGLFEPEVLPLLGLPEELFHPEGIEFYGKLSFLKAGIFFADRITTVSPTYCQEILTPESGCGFEGILRSRQKRLSGILNGIDPEDWNPAADSAVPYPYAADSLDGKALCKRRLQRELGLPQQAGTPLLAMVTRIDRQKGIDLVLDAWPRLARRPVQLALLGSGDRALSARLQALAAADPDRVAIRLGFDDALARRIYAGADLFLMPSRFEPCGLGQLIALRYGAVPLVRSTGGLADTIFDIDSRPQTGNGFCFEQPTSQALLQAVDRALARFGERTAWRRLVAVCMRQDYSWRRSASRYLDLYLQTLEEHRERTGKR
ncbi:glycogen synthase (ADP-glucose) [Geothermobacter ehrlichii]|uniref:Glycogen synthase n=1 Tax=Geothermobacter ehrlichii TaxID=213224 RepID=A0A5D3WJH3_9BACT|nr:glycogen synthase GlgA [Geothermobacter ehrlichii]TYO99073.1 glycogen synthase (ADP-glucose) [Geothermobacter ehrlichii]